MKKEFTISDFRFTIYKNIVQKKNIILFLFFFSFSVSVFAETEEEIEKVAEIEKHTKGLSLVALPLLSFDTDLGVEFGAFANLYHFGDGSRFPQYDHFFAIEYSRNTKGGQKFASTFDSDRLIKNIRTNLDIMYSEDLLAFFFGFNGYNAVFSPEMEQMNRAFYRYQNKTFRIKPDFQGHFGDSPFGWIAGVSFMHVNPGSVDVARINSDKTNSINNLPDDPNMYLFNKYVKWGIISPEETEKRWLNYVKIGAKYDTRDFMLNPFKGIFTEVMLQGAPAVLGNYFPHAKFAVIHRQYVPIVQDGKLNFAYRVFYQTTVGNSKVPFYAQPLLMSSFETSSMTQGLGGARTLRGVMKNRVVGDGFVMVNAEFRLKIFQFALQNQFFDIYINPFVDAGYITKEIDISKPLSQLSEEDRTTFFREGKQGIHASAGLGFKLILNHNFVMSVETGKPFDKRDGDIFRVYLNTSYTF